MGKMDMSLIYSNGFSLLLQDDELEAHPLVANFINHKPWLKLKEGGTQQQVQDKRVSHPHSNVHM